MTKYKSQVATLNKLEIQSENGTIIRKFTEKTLNELAKSAIGKSVLLGFNGIKLGEISNAWVEDGSVYVEFEGDSFDRKYLVPGFKITSSKGEEFQTVRCMDFALVDKPVDKTLKTIPELNDHKIDSYIESLEKIQEE